MGCVFSMLATALLAGVIWLAVKIAGGSRSVSFASLDQDGGVTRVLLDQELFAKQQQQQVEAREPADVIQFARQLSAFAATDDMFECAKQMQQLVRSRALDYQAHESDPERILKVSGFISTDHTSLVTRFTVQYNLYAGSIVALGSDQQRRELYDTQDSGELGCFAFTEIGAGVMTGVRVDTVAEFDRERNVFVFSTPTPDARKNWISQGATASRAVVLARLKVDGRDLGAHLFWVPLRQPSSASSTLELPPLLPGISISLVAAKSAMLSLDNAVIDFDGYTAPRSALLSRFCTLEADGTYTSRMPAGCRRFLDLVLTRLLTGRLCLAEFGLSYAQELLRHNWAYCQSRSLFRGEQKMSQVLAPFFIDRTRSLRVLQHFIARSRQIAADCIKAGNFTQSAVELASVSKFIGTGFACDTALSLRKVMGSEALFERSRLGMGLDVFLAMCFAEGDNAIMEQKIVLDTALGRTARFPQAIFGLLTKQPGVVGQYLLLLARAMWLGKAAQHELQLLKDLAWAKAHLLVLSCWYSSGGFESRILDAMVASYLRVLVRFPVPAVL